MRGLLGGDARLLQEVWHHSQITPLKQEGPDKVSAAVGPVLASESALPGVGYVVRPQEWKDVEKADTCAHCGANGQLCFEQTETVESCPRCGCRSVTRATFLDNLIAQLDAASFGL